MICPYCGTENDQSATNCANCNNLLNPGINNNPGSETGSSISPTPDPVSAPELEQTSLPVSEPSSTSGQEVIAAASSVNDPIASTSLTDFELNNKMETPVESTDAMNPTMAQFNNKKPNIKLFAIIGVAIILLVAIISLAISISGRKKSNKSIEKRFDDDKLIAVYKNKKYGYINLEGKEVIGFNYDYGKDFNGDYAVAKIGNDDAPDIIINKKGETVLSGKEIEYNEDYDFYTVDGKLYNNKLKPLASETMEVEDVGFGYISWSDSSNNTAGIMDATGKILYKTSQKGNSNYIDVEPSDIDKSLNERYCKVSTGAGSAIVNCDTGKVVYDYGDYVISDEDDNIFEISDSTTYKRIEIIFINNNKVAYRDKNEDTDLSYYGKQLVIYAPSGTKYYDLKTDKVSSERFNTYNPDELDEWELYTGYKKVLKSPGGYRLEKDGKVIIDNNYSDIDFIDLDAYKYLESLGKEYIIARGTDADNTYSKNYYIVNIKNGKEVYSFNGGLKGTSGGLFLLIEIDYKDYYFSLMSGKKVNVSDSGFGANTYDVYMTIHRGDKLDYYNYNLDLIYTGDYR